MTHDRTIELLEEVLGVLKKDFVNDPNGCADKYLDRFDAVCYAIGYVSAMKKLHERPRVDV